MGVTSARGRGLVALALAGALAGSAAPAAAGCEASIRVLLDRTGDALELTLDGRRHRVRVAEAGIRVDGGPVVAEWAAPPFRSGRVGGIRTAGPIRAIRSGPHAVVVGSVPLERYVSSTIGGEMPASWSAEALRAQAVVSRTYALHQRRARRSRAWDVEAGTRSQVFRGLDVPPEARSAARATACQVLTYRGAPILAAFHSASGGRTASAGEVWGREIAYLVSLEVVGEDDSPDTYWRAAASRSKLGRTLAAAGHAIGDVTGARVEARSESGRVARIRFRGERGTVTLSGRQLRSALGESVLRSTLFELRESEDGFVFVGSGRGHGVGMSQWAARGLAEQGASYREILMKFYPGTTLGPWPGGRRAALRP